MSLILISLNFLFLLISVFFSCKGNFSFFFILRLLADDNLVNLLYTSFVCSLFFYFTEYFSNRVFGKLNSSEFSYYYEIATNFLTETSMTAASFPHCLYIKNLAPFCLLYCIKSLCWVFKIKTEREKSFFYKRIGIFLIVVNSVFIKKYINLFNLRFITFEGLIGLEYCLTTLYVFKYVLFLNLELFNEKNPYSTFTVNFLYYGGRVLLVGIFALNLNRYRLPINFLKVILFDIKQLKTKIKSFYNYHQVHKEIGQSPDVKTNEICIICTDEIKEGKQLECNHIFHKDCLKSWCENENICPICRKKIKFIKENK